jgi:CRISPR-associated protein Cmr4
VGAIELPIAREKPTHIPIVPGSSLKGVLRAQKKVEGIHLAAFGPETEHAADQAGAVQFGDARLVLLPMRSVAGVFAWTTSPYLLRRLKKDLETIRSNDLWPQDPSVSGQSCLLPGGSVSVLKTSMGRVVLDDLDFEVLAGEPADDIARILGRIFFPENEKDQAFLKAHFCIVPDDVMGLLLEMGTELQTHVRLDPNTKTVAKGALWQEESLPVESLLASLVVVNGAEGKVKAAAEGIQAHLVSLCHEKTLQFGGKASVGKGLCRIGLV